MENYQISRLIPLKSIRKRVAFSTLFSTLTERDILCIIFSLKKDTEKN